MGRPKANTVTWECITLGALEWRRTVIGWRFRLVNTGCICMWRGQQVGPRSGSSPCLFFFKGVPTHQDRSTSPPEQVEGHSSHKCAARKKATAWQSIYKHHTVGGNAKVKSTPRHDVMQYEEHSTRVRAHTTTSATSSNWPQGRGKPNGPTHSSSGS